MHNIIQKAMRHYVTLTRAYIQNASSLALKLQNIECAREHEEGDEVKCIVRSGHVAPLLSPRVLLLREWSANRV